jgi:hypothetical protein
LDPRSATAPVIVRLPVIVVVEENVFVPDPESVKLPGKDVGEIVWAPDAL